MLSSIFEAPSSSTAVKGHHLRVVALVFLVGLALASAAAQAGSSNAEFQLERISPRENHVAPGQSTTYTLRITNIGTVAASAHLGDEGHSSYASLDDFPGYSLTQSNRPGCGELGRELTGFLNDYRFVFDTETIAVGASIECVMTVGRETDALHDMDMYWGVRSDPSTPTVYDHYTEVALFGTLTDVSIEMHSSGFHIDDAGLAHATTELRIHNGGSMPISSQIAGACEDNFLRPFLTDGSGPGGCGSDRHVLGCFDWGYGFVIPEVAAGDTYRCRIQLTSWEPYQSPLTFPISIGYVQVGAGHSFIDTNRANNDTLIRLEPDQVAVAATPVPLATRLALVLFAGSLALAAVVKFRAAG